MAPTEVRTRTNNHQLICIESNQFRCFDLILGIMRNY